MSTHEYVIKCSQVQTLVIVLYKNSRVWHISQYAKLSAKWYVQSDKQVIITDWLSRSVHIDENYLFILSKMTNHNCKQWKLMHKQ